MRCKSNCTIPHQASKATAGRDNREMRKEARLVGNMSTSFYSLAFFRHMRIVVETNPMNVRTDVGHETIAIAILPPVTTPVMSVLPHIHRFVRLPKKPQTNAKQVDRRNITRKILRALV